MESQDTIETKELPREVGARKGYFGKLRKVYEFARYYMNANTNLPYHNFSHAKDVAHAALRLAKEYSLDGESRFLLATAALMHDTYYAVGGKHNEEISARLTMLILPELGYRQYQVESASRLVQATKMPTSPRNLLEQIMCDADLDNLGRADALQLGHALRLEYGIENLTDWYSRQYQFLKGHQYYTESAKKSREKGLRENIAKLERLAGMA
jgi:predicted metal-dependent HD superfamily phosphohydrolase